MKFTANHNFSIERTLPLQRTLLFVDELPPLISRFGFDLSNSGIHQKQKCKAMRNRNQLSFTI